MTEQSELRRKTEELLAQIDKGSRSHLTFGSDVSIDRLEAPSIGITAGLNGGWGMGRQVLIWGPKSAGKSTLTMRQIAIAQELGKVCAYFDTEKTFDPSWAVRLGVDIDSLIVNDRGSINALVNDGTALMRAGIDFLAVDSISALMPGTYVDENGELKPFEKTGAIGGLARGLSSALSQLNYANDNTLLWLISQTRMAQKGGMHWGIGHTGGQSVGFYSSQVLRLQSSESKDNTIKGEIVVGDRIIEKPIGRKVTWTVDWNKLGPQGSTGEYDLYYDGDFVGIDICGEMLQIGVDLGVVRKGGAWYYYGEEKVGNGKHRAAAHLRENEELYRRIKEDIYARE